MSDRRQEPRERQVWQPHPDQVRECVGVWDFYKDLPEADMPIEEKIRKVISAAEAWKERWDAEERRAFEARNPKRREIAWNASVQAWVERRR